MIEPLLDKCEALYNRGDYENLIKTCDEVLEIEKEEPASMNYKAISLYYLGKYDEATEILDHCLKLHPTNHYTLNNKALVYIAQGEYEKALECCEKGLESRDLDWLQINKIESLIHLGRTDEAYQYYQSVQIPYYTFQEALDNCGVTEKRPKDQLDKVDELFQEKKYEEVLRLCGETETSERLMDYWIVSLICLKRFDEALKITGDAIDAYPYNPCFPLFKAKISLMCRDIDAAIEGYEQAFRIDGLSNHRLEINDYNQCIAIKTHILIDSGEHEEAIRTLQKTIKTKNGKFE